MIIYNVLVDNLIRERWEDEAVPRQVTKWDAQGNIEPGYPRAYTAEENAAADFRLSVEAAEKARELDRAAVKSIITDIQVEIDRYDAVLANVNATGREKDLARAGKRVAKATIDIARLLKNF